MFKKISFIILLVAIAIPVYLRFFLKRNRWNMERVEKFAAMENIWNPEELKELRSMYEYPGFKITTFFQDRTSVYEDIGERVPVNAEGKCDDDTLVLNKNKTHCIYYQKNEVIMHYFKTGGYHGHKEKLNDMISRLDVFAKYRFDNLSNDSQMKKLLYDTPAFRKAVDEICPNKPYIDPIHFCIILNIPGQEVGMHYEVSWFKGAGRFSFPQYVLVAMEQSRLFKDLRIDQIQAVGYLHEWDPTTPVDKGGEFVFYPDELDGTPYFHKTKPNSGLLVDGSLVSHTTTTFIPGAKPQVYDKELYKELEYNGQTWDYYVNGTKVNTFTKDQIRVTLLWRCKCFKDEAEMLEFKNAKQFTLDEVLDVFIKDLKKRGKIPENGPLPTRKELGSMLVNEYVRFPLPKDPLFPYNYCLLDKISPRFIKPYAKFFVDTFC